MEAFFAGSNHSLRNPYFRSSSTHLSDSLGRSDHSASSFSEASNVCFHCDDDSTHVEEDEPFELRLLKPKEKICPPKVIGIDTKPKKKVPQIAVGESIGSVLTTTIMASKFLSILRKARQKRNIYSAPASVEVKKHNHSTTDTQFLRRALKRNWIFAHRSKEQRVRLVSAFELVTFEAGHVLLTQGQAKDNYFYVLKSGSVEFLQDGTVVGSTSMSGDAFGELSLLYASPQTSTVRAVTQSQFFRVDQPHFTSVLELERKRTLEKKLKCLKKVVPWKDDKERLRKVADNMTAQVFAEGQLVCPLPNEVWIIRQGKIQTKTKILGKGDVLEGPGKSLSSGMAFGSKEIKEPPKKKSKKTTSPLANVPYYEKASDIQLEQLSKLMVHRRYRKDALLAVEGNKIKPALYIVQRGKVQIKLADGCERVLSKGEHFGEDLLTGEVKIFVTCTFTATALETCECGVLTLRDSRTQFVPPALSSSSSSCSPPVSPTMSSPKPKQTLPPKRASMRDIPKPPKALLRRTQSASLRRRSSLDLTPKKTKPKKPIAQLPLQPKDLKRHKILGEGTFGQVWLVTSELEAHLKPYALKIQSKYELIQEGQVKPALREKSVMEALDHPFLMKLYQTYQDATCLYSVMDFVQGGELFSLLHPSHLDFTPLPEAQCMLYGLAIADALAYMHDMSFVHRDLKPENVLIDAKGYPILIDMGFAKKMDDVKTYTTCGTPGYLAPEIILSKGHGYAADHWSLGILLAEMLTGENPYYDPSLSQIEYFRNVIKDPYELPSIVPPQAANLIDGFLKKDPSQRIGSLQNGELDILTHPWFEILDLHRVRKRKIKAPYRPEVKSPMDCCCFDDWNLKDKSKQRFPKLKAAEETLFEKF